MSAQWSSHVTPEGKTYFYDRVSGISQWDRPKAFQAARHVRPTIDACLDESTHVAGLFNAIIKHCGTTAVPAVVSRPAEGDPLCDGGRGGAFCCASRKIYICTHGWVGCREVAYELSHALNVCRGLVRCSSNGMSIDGADCGYLSPPDVACSELRASYWTGRCARRGEGDRMQRCLEWHARWATSSCYPDDEHLEAHVRWARHKCSPAGDDMELTRSAGAPTNGQNPHSLRRSASLNLYVDQAHRWTEA